ncbi:hypothetical protein Q2T76_01105 [Lactobacillus sp. YT155]|uniref:hypothetical protein n=1 Tax=Lactobacillus sp. YT155 TaxID=3060955 RepID=UPI00265EC28F|nr:hypothetical protein [Lactobacillus sp. YT155]MDO1604648.1 hypothetical protein [Lactobacillus sp. YT155]
MKWISKSAIFSILILELILIGILGYSQNIEQEKNALILFGISVSFVGYLVSFKLRGDIVEALIKQNQNKTKLRATGMIIFLLGLAVIGLSFII